MFKGIAMKIYYYAMFEGPGYCENWIADALNRNGHYCHRIEKTLVPWEKFEERTLKEHPDAVLFSKISEVTQGQFEAFRKLYHGKIIFWTFDYMKKFGKGWYLPIAPLADICFQTDGIDHDGYYEDHNINRVELHQAAAIQHDLPKSITHEDLEKWNYDVIFMGSLYSKEREKLHKKLSGLGVNYKHFGYPEEELWGADFAKACYFSKIVIGDNYRNDIPGYWSDRSYLTLGCGGFLITAHVPLIEKYFCSGKHLVLYHTIDDLPNFIEYYLEREGTRKLIALEGYRYVRQHHTYDRRIEVFNHHLKQL